MGSILNYFYDDKGSYNVEMLWRISRHKKIRHIDSEDLIPHIRHRLWGDNIRSPLGIINAPTVDLNDEEMDHLKRVFRANLNYPILLYENDITSEYFIVDGVHRVIKSILFDIDYIKYVQITDNNLRRSFVGSVNYNVR
jgi:hypothetical protein